MDILRQDMLAKPEVTNRIAKLEGEAAVIVRKMAAQDGGAAVDPSIG